jgi:hypothetical protein
MRNFFIYPKEFYLKRGEGTELFINFQPEKEGILSEKVVLACDDLTSRVYTLKGTNKK